ncbi:MAG: MarR family winged helix-turn-helix transcriptional regulator [Roseibium sp.]
MKLDLHDINFQQMGQTCFGHSARRTANLLTRHFNRHLAPFGLEITQAQLLAVIASGNALSASDIARFLGIERSTLARNLKPLEAAGLISREKTSGRKVVPSLLPKGQALVCQLHSTWQTAQKELTDHLGDETAAAIQSRMSDLRKAVRHLEQASPSNKEPDNSAGAA